LSSNWAVADAYDSLLTHSILSNRSYNSISGASLGKYALFPNGTGNADIYDDALTKVFSIPGLSAGHDRARGVTIGDYALFGGGIVNNTVTNLVESYSLV